MNDNDMRLVAAIADYRIALADREREVATPRLWGKRDRIDRCNQLVMDAWRKYAEACRGTGVKAEPPPNTINWSTDGL